MPLKIPDRDLRQVIERIAEAQPGARAKLQDLLEGKLERGDVEALLTDPAARFEAGERAALQRVLGGVDASAPDRAQGGAPAPKGTVSLHALNAAERARSAQAAPAGSWWQGVQDAALHVLFPDPQRDVVEVNGERFTKAEVEAMLVDVGARPQPRAVLVTGALAADLQALGARSR